MDIAVFYALGSVFMVSLVSLVGILFLSLNARVLKASMFLLVSLAVGALFGDALIHLIPEAYESSASPEQVSLFVLLGIFSFFILEKFLHWRHRHGIENVHEVNDLDPKEQARHKIKPLGGLVIVSDSVHNFLDGFIIGASYLVSIEVGIATTTAIILHEIPQEISDFGLLLHSGFKKMQALFVNFLSALTAVLGTILALSLSGMGALFVPAATAFAAGSFLYIAGADLVPELHKVTNYKKSLLQLIAILVGVGAMWALLFID